MRSWLVLLSIAISACGDAAASRSSLAVEGNLTGVAPADGAATVLVWLVGEEGYKFGEGTVLDERFVLDVDGGPPASALERDVGVGVVMLVSDAPDDGVIAESEVDVLGMAPGQAIIWVGDAPGRFEWDSDFPPGYSCARCVERDEGNDVFEPIDCGDMEVVVGGAGGCNFM